ncbi:TPA: DUF2544 domain-containing protein [Escherichia albertii]|nr:DUF2544 domain-containing protein [Escherichia albertii]HEB1499690.1 DUF2544 domain-containing protein [Escherichia albertii]
MKMTRYFLGLLMLLSFGGQADTYVGDLHTYFGAGNPTMTNFTLYLEVVTPHGTYYGTYQEPSQRLNTGNITNIYWSDTTGTIHAPRLNMGAASGAGSIGPCPGVHDAPNTSAWGCYSTNISVYVDQPVGGCPWLISSYITTFYHSTFTGDQGPYTGPKAHNSSCPPVAVAPYDVSWDENYVAHNKTVRLPGGGGVVTQTLSTYLMKDGQLCDGSQPDERGLYCRLVAQLMTFTASGCDDARVSVTPTPHPITDKQLHDMVLQVNTSNNVPAIAATCRFQYILNEL